MSKISFRILMVLLAMLMLFSIVACQDEVQPEPEPEPKECVVTFDYQNGTEAKTVTVLEGEKVKQPSTDPTRDGYYFGGWWTKNTNGTYKSAYKFSKTVTGDLNLYAMWWTTEYYMPAGWTQTIPVWSAPDTGTVTVPDMVLKGDFETKVTNVTPELEQALATAIATPDYFKDPKNIIIFVCSVVTLTC